MIPLSDCTVKVSGETSPSSTTRTFHLPNWAFRTYADDLSVAAVGYFEPNEITQKLATMMSVPSARYAFVRPLTPFHSPRTTPMRVEKKIVDAITTANEMYLRSPISGSPAFWQTNWNTQITPMAEAKIQFRSKEPHLTEAAPPAPWD